MVDLEAAAAAAARAAIVIHFLHIGWAARQEHGLNGALELNETVLHPGSPGKTAGHPHFCTIRTGRNKPTQMQNKRPETMIMIYTKPKTVKLTSRAKAKLWFTICDQTI